MLWKQNRVIFAAINKRHFKTTHKFGIKDPKTVKEADELDKENGKTRWCDTFAKEMKVVRIAFDILENG